MSDYSGTAELSKKRLITVERFFQSDITATLLISIYIVRIIIEERRGRLLLYVRNEKY